MCRLEFFIYTYFSIDAPLDSVSESDPDVAALAAAALMDSDSSHSTEGALGGRLLASIFGGTLHHEAITQPSDDNSDEPDHDAAFAAALALSDSDDEDTAFAAAAALCDSDNDDGALGGRLLGALVGGQLLSNIPPIPTIASPFTAQYFSQIPQDWIHPTEGDEED